MADTGNPTLRQEDLLAFLKTYAPERRRGGEKEMLAGRWRILTNQPIAELSSPFARAYSARDEKSPDTLLYALVFEDGTPLRQKNIAALKTYRHPALAPLIAEGLVQIGAASETRYVVVMGRPAGTLLSEMLARKGNPVPESLILQNYVRPLAEVAVAFSKLGISHNRIHPGNIYVSGNQITLGECVSEPSGFSQNYLFEPIERIQTSPRAKADFASGADCYALAVLAVHLALGYFPFEHADKERVIRNILNSGAYHALVAPWELPASLQDFLRGILGDARRERWDAAMVESWLSGRRFNLIMPSMANETPRGFDFAGEIHFNRKSLAHGLQRHWKEALTLVSDHRIARWIKMHVHKPETADAIAKVTFNANTFTPQQEEDALARIIILLDPQGPLRLRQMSVSIDGIGTQLAYSFIAERHDEVQVLTQMLDNDLTGFYIEQQKGTPEWTALAAKLQKARSHMRMKSIGFGLERTLYDLNMGLPCLSPMLKGHHVTTLAEMLAALDAISAQKALAEDVGDRHVAAFIASRLDLSKEIQMHELHAIASLKSNPTLLMLKLLAQAQSKSGEHAYPGLTHWLGVRALPLLAALHGRARKRKLQGDLGTAINKGALGTLAGLLITPASFEADRRDFQKASGEYSLLTRRIATLKGSSGISQEADLKGYGVAQSIAYGICIATVYVTLKSYFHL